MPSDDEIQQLLLDPSTSTWLSNALTAALCRDPVDAANDADLMALVLDRRAKKILKAAGG